VVAGNIGLPVLEGLQNSAEIYVLELSSYQLEDTPSLAPWAATVLNISDDHLDRYLSRQAYIDAKANIYRNARFAIINRDDPCCRVMPAHGEHLTFGLGEPPTAKDAGIQMLDREPWLVVQGIPILKVAELGLKGAHHTANALAAILLALCANASLDAIRETLRSFQGCRIALRMWGRLVESISLMIPKAPMSARPWPPLPQCSNRLFSLPAVMAKAKIFHPW